MKTKLKLPFIAPALLVLLSVINQQLSIASAQGTAFTYQGQLQNNGAPANGTYDLQFTLYTNSTGGTAAAGPVTNSAVGVTNGLFTVTMDFGSGPWNGQTNWLEIAVETNGGSSFTTLAPRQQLTPIPYAIYAESAVALANGVAIGMGEGNTISSPATYDSFIGGGQDNSIAADTFWGTYGVIGGGQHNTIQASAGLSVIGGGSYNTIQTNGYWSTIAGGVDNVITTNGQMSAVGGGYGNEVNSSWSTIAGGYENAINSYGSAIAGGRGNINGTLSPYAFIGGGLDNNNSAFFFGTIGGGVSNTVYGASGVIGGGNNNYIGGSSSVIGGGAGNSIGNEYSFIGGGDNNYVGGSSSVIGGGYQNFIYSTYSFIGSGDYNNIYAGASYSTIGSGCFNQIIGNAPYSMIGSGLYNLIYGDTNDYGTSVIVGGYIDVINSNSWNSFIGGGGGNTIGTNSDHSVIVGGFNNTILGLTEYAMIGGGDANVIGPDGLGGGSADSVIGGGFGNTIDEFDSFIGGGQQNFIHGTADHSVIGGGGFNNIAGSLGPSFNVIGGGNANAIQTNSSYVVIPGGYQNVAGGVGSFAAGQNAQATNNGAFVWSDDSTTNPFSSTTPNQFSVRATGGVRLVTGGAGMTLDGQSLGPLGNYVFAFSTTPQNVTPTIFQNVTFTTNAQLNGWISISGTQFQCNQTGLYLVQYTAEASVQDSMSMRAELNFIEIPGSQAYASSTSFGTVTVISRSFLASVVSPGSILAIQYTGNSPSDELVGGGAGSTLPSVSLTITRIQ
jgi:hypothetical protein